MNIQNILLEHIHHALESIQIKYFLHLVTIQPSTRPKFGNYQINGLITISKKLNLSIEKIAPIIIAKCNLHDIAEIIKFEKPGFINIFLKKQWVENQTNYIASASNLGIIPVISPKTIIIDYSSPNIAKEMHVGHLRSTVIGDSMACILSFLGHNVIRANHIGDWGTQFGTLIAYIKKHYPNESSLNKILKFPILEHLYQEAKKQYDTDTTFAKLSRSYVVKLQQGDKQCRQIWKYLKNISIVNNQKLYTRLNITLQKNDVMRKSVYHDMLSNIVTDLKNKKIAVTSNDATVVFLNHSNINKHNSSFGVIIQKQDGAYLYSTTDIACIKYRCETLQADRIIYYTDSRQKQHLIQAWKIASKAGYIKKSTSLEHHICGMLLEKNGKPFQTRAGNALKLKILLDESIKRARESICNKNPDLKSDKIDKLAHIIGIGAIKYSELSKNRTTNYIFNWDNMLNFEGNTAPYIQYAYTRIFSIFKQSKQSPWKLKKYNIYLNTQEEMLLATCLLQFYDTITTVANRGTPHMLCTYLYKLSVVFSLFYENCPILNTNKIYIKYSRLKLALLTARILKKGLRLLGIKTAEYM